MLSFTNGHGTGSVRCVDHKCNNCIKYTADDPAIASLLSRVRNEIRFIRASPDRRKVFRDIQWERLRPQNDEAEDDRAAVDEERDEQDAAEAAEANDFLPRSPGAYRRSRAKALEKQKRPWILILDCPTRWSSTFFMVERYVQLFEDLLLFQLRGGFNEYDQETYGPPVSYDEYLLLTSWADALAPVADFIRIAEGEKYPTMGWVCPLFKHVLDCINPQNEPMVLEQEKHFRKVLERSLQKRLGFLLKKPNIALATSALHPAFARLHFVSCATMCGKNWRRSLESMERWTLLTATILRQSLTLSKGALTLWNRSEFHRTTLIKAGSFSVACENHSPSARDQAFHCQRLWHMLQQTSCLILLIGGGECRRANPMDLSCILQRSYFALLQPPPHLSESFQVRVSMRYFTVYSLLNRRISGGALVVSELRSLTRRTKGWKDDYMPTVSSFLLPRRARKVGRRGNSSLHGKVP